MAQQNRTVLKGYFNTGDTPTEAQFADLIDSFHNPTNDGTVQVQPSEGAFANGDKTKLDGIEALADVTDETNVLAALNGATITAVTPTLTDKVLHQDASDTSNIKTSTTEQLLELGTLTSAGAPASAPDFIGQIFNDTLNNDIYVAAATGSAGDWVKVTSSATTINFTGTNNTGSAIAAGTPVYFAGAGGSVAACDSDTASTFPCVGITSEELTASGGTGTVVVLGDIGSLDTSAYSEGDVLYVASGGGLTATEPTTGTVQPVAVVKTSDIGSGIILVDRQISGSATIKTSYWVPASSMAPATTSPAEAVKREYATNDVDLEVLRFDTAADEFATFAILMPKGWDEGTVTFQPVWTHEATTTNFDVTWAMQGRAFSNDDALDAAWGTAVTSKDTGGTTGDQYTGPESSAMTIGGTPAEGDLVVFRVFRDVDGAGTAGDDDLAIDADLIGVKVYYTINTLSEA